MDPENTQTENAPHFMYLLQEREFVNAQKQIYKIGKTKKGIVDRIKGYPKGSIVSLVVECDDCDKCEKELLKIFKTNYKQQTDIGLEYFEGNKRQMCKDIITYIYSNSFDESVNHKPKKEIREIDNYIQQINENEIKDVDLKVQQIIDEYIQDNDEENTKVENINTENTNVDIEINNNTDVIENIVQTTTSNKTDDLNIQINEVKTEAIKKPNGKKLKSLSDRTCNHCKKIFKYPSKLEAHLKNQNLCKMKPHIKHLVEQNETKEKSNTENIEKVKITIPNNEQNEQNKPEIIECEKCLRTFKHKQSLLRHIKLKRCNIEDTKEIEKITVIEKLEMKKNLIKLISNETDKDVKIKLAKALQSIT